MTWPGELRFAVRTLLKSPGFTAVAVAMLAVGIGVNATVFTVTSAVLFKGFPKVKANDRLLYVSNGGCCISYPDFEAIREQAKSFQGMGITHGIGVSLVDGAGFAERLDVTEISADTFPTVGVQPIAGRQFTHADQNPGAPAVALLNYDFWRRRYAKDPAAVGRLVRLSGVPTTIVGIMPEGFSFPQKAAMWVPLVETAMVKNRAYTNTWFAFGRLRDGVPFESAKAETEGIIQRLETEYPVTDQRQHLVVQNFAQFFLGQNAEVIYGSLWGAVGFVLLIVIANLANLLLARAIGMSREISVRIALGAGRWRIVRQRLIESILLAGAGGFLGWWIADWGVRTYALAMYQKSSWLILDYSMDHSVLAYIIAVSIGTGLLFGLAPALRLSKLDANEALKDGGRGATGGTRSKRLSAILVGGEMAMAVVLLAGAGVMIRSFLKIHNANMGVDANHILVGLVAPPASRYPNAAARISFFDRLETEIRAIPGIESAVLADSLPSWGSRRAEYELPADTPAGSRGRPKVSALPISPGYFATLRASVVAGRDFNDHDDASGSPVAIVNQKLASRFWPGKNALGERIRIVDGNSPAPWLTVVGVASDIVQNDQTRQRVDPVVYMPYRQHPSQETWVVARTALPPKDLETAFHKSVEALDPDLPMYGPMSLIHRIEGYSDNRFYGGLLLIFAGIALLLASIGLYTVIAHSVSQRTQEIGVRMAIGASAADIRRLILVQGMLPLAAGLAIGLVTSLAVNRLLKAELVDVSPSDPLTLAVASLALIAAALLGCWIPSRRAMRVDPVDALRHD
ncbi:MAG TPA: ABC transporter permease [Bryobacteraceae bacterium]|nr:ABC transporter permease [Bryobacteraceae bacterium]